MSFQIIAGVYMKNPDLVGLWSRLAEIMDQRCKYLVKVKDEIGYWRYEIPHRPADKGRLSRAQSPFGAVAAQKNHVGIYLLYAHKEPQSIEGLPPEIIARKKGKSMFAFTDEDDFSIEFVPLLIDTVYEYCVARGYISE